MDQENAKLAQDYQVQNNIPLLQDQQQENNQYYSPYNNQVQYVQQQVAQQQQLSNSYQGINLQGDQYQVNQQLQQQNPQLQQIIQPYQPNTNQQQITGIVIQTPQIYNLIRNASGFRTPTLISCPYCNKNAVTNVHFKSGDDTFCMAVLLCLCFGLLCLIPLLSSDCKDAYHRCSHCGRTVGFTPYQACQ
ncbi:unnamed protein product [Paramecium pentaurelia]|uniref:LITAF domain-containing protein n=1 Tax=Paramecium pentaurelia TaxID=43138 RepID=A0A8S1U1E3_9CILI|nr:unnamed protein product [Paramecium pentaurelia]